MGKARGQVRFDVSDPDIMFFLFADIPSSATFRHTRLFGTSSLAGFARFKHDPRPRSLAATVVGGNQPHAKEKLLLLALLDVLLRV